nr:hypothetical protein [uncultured Draconibacterium sp.]
MNDSYPGYEAKPTDLVVYPLEDKKIVWLPDVNKYILAEAVIAEVISAIVNEEPDHLILSLCGNQLKIDEDQALVLIDDVRKTLRDLRGSAAKAEPRDLHILSDFIDFQKTIKKYYRINNIIFFVEYETLRAVEINHPKFSHFEIEAVGTIHHHFKLLHHQNAFCLIADGENIGCWQEKDDHFLGGKFSMQILQRLYKKDESEWLGVFHAAGISNGKKGILFLGDSGNGKSTLSALLMANGFDVLSDDFLPVEKRKRHICRFPAAISVKKKAFSILSAWFPELDHSSEYSNPEANKVFRFLQLSNTDLHSVPCVALVFVKYEPGSGMEFTALSKELAFQKLIPDSWISPLADNVNDFLQWFDSLPCWQLGYSDNDAMLEKVKELFNDGC